MTSDLIPGIREACLYWQDAPMLSQTYQALEKSIELNNDGCIDCSKVIVEVISRIIVDELDSPTNPAKPVESTPSISTWVSAAIRVMKLGENRNSSFKKLVSNHFRLTETLGELRNAEGPLSHGRDGFLEKLSLHHRRSAILIADTIVSFLHQAYLETTFDLLKTREPFERFSSFNSLIDYHTGLRTQVEDDGTLTIYFKLPTDEEIPVNASASKLLFQLDREAYIEARNAAKSARPPELNISEELD